jgi:AcrR family transcriptional regulator
MIVDAVIPLLLEHGRALTSRQIAEAAGVAEGTIFRAFGDKESLVEAAILKHLDPEPLREALRSIDPSLPLEHKVRAILYLLRERFRSVMRIMPVIGGERPPIPQERTEFARIIAEVLRPESEALNWPPERVAHILRLMSFSSAFPALNDGQEFSIDDLARIVLTGIAGDLPAALASPVSLASPPVSAAGRPASRSASEEDPCS